MHNLESRHQTGHQTFNSFNLILIYLNAASGAAPQQGVAAPDGAPDFFQILMNKFKFI
jgi:hypothetical protein